MQALIRQLQKDHMKNEIRIDAYCLTKEQVHAIIAGLSEESYPARSVLEAMARARQSEFDYVSAPLLGTYPPYTTCFFKEERRLRGKCFVPDMRKIRSDEWGFRKAVAYPGTPFYKYMKRTGIFDELARWQLEKGKGELEKMAQAVAGELTDLKRSCNADAAWAYLMSLSEEEQYEEICWRFSSQALDLTIDPASMSVKLNGNAICRATAEQLQPEYEHYSSEFRFKEMYRDYLRCGGTVSDDIYRALESHLINVIHSEDGREQPYIPLNTDDCAGWILNKFYELGYERDDLFLNGSEGGTGLSGLISRTNAEIEKHNRAIERMQHNQRDIREMAETSKAIADAQEKRESVYPPEDKKIIAFPQKFVEIDIDM